VLHFDIITDSSAAWLAEERKIAAPASPGLHNAGLSAGFIAFCQPPSRTTHEKNSAFLRKSQVKQAIFGVASSDPSQLKLIIQ
jgi:hypothetical protein